MRPNPDIESTSSTPSQPPTSKSQCASVTSLLSSRHSTRAFLDLPVPRSILEEVLTLSQHSPSNSNLQPWRVKILTGAALSRLNTALVSTAQSGVQPSTEPIPESYRHYRSALGKQLYGPGGYDIKREDKEGMEKARLRNYGFFGAPCGMVVYMDEGLAQVDVLSTGMWVQSVCLLLAEQGIGTCVEASVAGYGEVSGAISLIFLVYA
jgi:nitroreductase